MIHLFSFSFLLLLLFLSGIRWNKDDAHGTTTAAVWRDNHGVCHMIRGLIIFIFFLLLSSDFNGVGSISLSSKEAYTLQSVSPLLRIPTSLTRSLQLSTLLSLPYFFFLLYLLLFLLLEIQRPSQVTNCRISGRRPSRAEARPSILSPSAPSLSLCNFRRLVSLLENVGGSWGTSNRLSTTRGNVIDDNKRGMSCKQMGRR